MTFSLHTTSTFNVRASFNKWLMGALANMSLPQSVTYSFTNLWPTTAPTVPTISVTHADIAREPGVLGRVVGQGEIGVDASALAQVDIWVSRTSGNWQLQMDILKSALEAVCAGYNSVSVKNYINTPTTPTNAYIDQVIAVDSANLIKYHPMRETTGTTADDYSSANLDGTYNGVTLNSALGPDFQSVPLFADTGDYLNVYSSAFASAFNGSEGTMSLWLRPNAASVWTDGTARGILRFDDGNFFNSAYIFKNAVNNLITFAYVANSTSKTVNHTVDGSADWVMASLTWSAAADQMKAYINGAQTGSTQTGLGAWNGVLSSTYAVAGNTTASGSQANQWKGNLAHIAVWDAPLTAAQIAILYTIQRDYAFRISNLDGGEIIQDTANPDIVRSRHLLRYDWTLRTNVR